MSRAPFAGRCRLSRQRGTAKTSDGDIPGARYAGYFYAVSRLIRRYDSRRFISPVRALE